MKIRIYITVIIAYLLILIVSVRRSHSQDMQIELDLNIPLSTTGGQDMQIGLDRSHNILLSISYVMEHNKKFILDTINTLQDNNKDKLRELYETLIADMPTAK